VNMFKFNHMTSICYYMLIMLRLIHLTSAR